MSPSYAPDVVTGEMCEQGCRAVVIYSLLQYSGQLHRPPHVII